MHTFLPLCKEASNDFHIHLPLPLASREIPPVLPVQSGSDFGAVIFFMGYEVSCQYHSTSVKLYWQQHLRNLAMCSVQGDVSITLTILLRQSNFGEGSLCAAKVLNLRQGDSVIVYSWTMASVNHVGNDTFFEC